MGKLSTRNFRKVLSSGLELPKEIILNVPLISITGKESISIENFKNILEYEEDFIRINTSCGVVRIEGKKLYIKHISAQIIVVSGSINKIEFLL